MKLVRHSFPFILIIVLLMVFFAACGGGTQGGSQIFPTPPAPTLGSNTVTQVQPDGNVTMGAGSPEGTYRFVDQGDRNRQFVEISFSGDTFIMRSINQVTIEGAFVIDENVRRILLKPEIVPDGFEHDHFRWSTLAYEDGFDVLYSIFTAQVLANQTFYERIHWFDPLVRDGQPSGIVEQFGGDELKGSSALIGRWNSPYGSSYEFHADGTMYRFNPSGTAGTWELNGNRLTISLDGGSSNRAWFVRVEGDALTMHNLNIIPLNVESFFKEQ
ncbi:MAG: hypothetical protein FWE34_00160 [Defluviitaleaceae bacterium]|nr:hypothetical protein [Defluviitaleaceae bacterium]